MMVHTAWLTTPNMGAPAAVEVEMHSDGGDCLHARRHGRDFGTFTGADAGKLWHATAEDAKKYLYARRMAIIDETYKEKDKLLERLPRLVPLTGEKK